LGGTDAESNRSLACASCNLAKSDRVVGRDSVTNQEVALFHPREQIWHEHFCWSEDKKTLIGITLTGRATIICLDMNNNLQQLARFYWFAAGLLP
jgi:hypothetical protein